MSVNRALLSPAADWEALRAGFRWILPDRYNIAERCCDSWAAAEPDRVALIDEAADGAQRRWTYGELADASNRLANAFRARGVGRGDRVAVLLPQGPAVLISHFAAMKLGAIALPLFTLFGPDALRFRLADSGASVVVTDGANLEKLLALRADLPDLKEVYALDGARPPVRDFWNEIAAARPALDAAVTGPDDPAVIIYTSGTTGAPKGTLHGHRFLAGHLPSIELHHEFFPRSGDLGWTPADWAWIGGLMDMAMPCLHYGVPLVSRRMRKFDADAAFALIARHGVRNLFLPPTALKLMRGARVPSGVNIRSVGSGGESLGGEILEWGRSALGAPINEFYGQTECNLVVTTCSSAMEVRPGWMGKATPGFDVAIIDAAGTPLPDGETGEIAVRRGTPCMFLKYWGQPEKTAEKFAGDWLRTGDLGMRDDEGYFRYVAREDDVITSAGYRIGPSEIEDCLTGHPDVVMAAAVGVPDPVRSQVVRAYVVLRDGAVREGLEKSLIDRVRNRISPHVAPREVVFRDSLPMTATGKIMRRELREAEIGRNDPSPGAESERR
jgi:acetyl-CoA synthetase